MIIEGGRRMGCGGSKLEKLSTLPTKAKWAQNLNWQCMAEALSEPLDWQSRRRRLDPGQLHQLPFP